jgi:RND family efflux transporter MFP subunit
LPAAAVATVEPGPAEIEITLPGNIEPMIEAPIHARAEGYIMRRIADIGDKVARGQLLAEIESPELVQQIREVEATLRRRRAESTRAEADLDQARTNLELAQATAERWKVLVGKGVLSKQDGDEKQAAFEARKAELAGAEAAVQAAREAIAAGEAELATLNELDAFRRIRAPFDGVITYRGMDVGSLVSGGGVVGRELFRLAQADSLRVYIQVPQSEVQAVQLHQSCEIEVDEQPGKRFEGRVTRTAGALDSSTRTMLTEVQVANQEALLLPGMYVHVRFHVLRANPPLLIPSNALRIGHGGPQVAVLLEGNTVQFTKVRLGRDYGARIEVLEGLQPGQRIVTTLTDEIREGITVRPVVPVTPRRAPKASQGIER